MRLTRRGLLARIPAALATVPLLGGVLPSAEPDAQATAATIYEEANVGWNADGFIVDRWAGGVYRGYERLGPAVRSIMVRANNGVVRALVAPWRRPL